MRFVFALLGVIVSLPLLLFFGVGAQTFIRPAEQVLAVVMVCAALGLLALSIALLVAPSLQRFQMVVLGATIAVAAGIAVWAESA